MRIWRCQFDLIFDQLLRIDGFWLASRRRINQTHVEHEI